MKPESFKIATRKVELATHTFFPIPNGVFRGEGTLGHAPSWLKIHTIVMDINELHKTTKMKIVCSRVGGK